MVRPIIWQGDSLKRVREFPEKARGRAGFELWEVQRGNSPSDWKPVSAAGPGVREIRVHADGEFRLIYVAQFDEAVYVLHAFGKKSRRTLKPDIDLARTRYRALILERNRK